MFRHFYNSNLTILFQWDQAFENKKPQSSEKGEKPKIYAVICSFNIKLTLTVTTIM